MSAYVSIHVSYYSPIVYCKLYTHTQTHTCAHTQKHTYTHTQTRTHTQTHTHTHTHTHTQTHTHVCLYVCMSIFSIHTHFNTCCRYCQLEEPAPYRKGQLHNSLKLHEFYHDVEYELS